MIDAVLSYHANPATCGVTKFNIELAKQLGVPHDDLGSGQTKHPLISIKTSEIGPHWQDYLPVFAPYELLLHDRPTSVYAAPNLARVVYADEIGCPATLKGDSTRPGLTILSFGMSHKCQQQHFERLQTLLDGRAYTLCVSAAIHEGHPWDEATAEHERVMRGIFGAHLRFLGFLADDALAREIRDAHLVALFYDPAVRANNTTLWAALDAGTPVITNLDAQSPPELIHGKNVFDLAQLTHWPDASELRVARFGGREVAKVYSWERVISRLQAVHV